MRYYIVDRSTYWTVLRDNPWGRAKVPALGGARFVSKSAAREALRLVLEGMCE